MIGYEDIQQIAKGVVETSAACDGQLYTGVVTSGKPLKIKLGIDVGNIELEGDDIILTESVVSKKLYIKKHKHEESSELKDVVSAVAGEIPVAFTPGGDGITLKHKHSIATSTLDAWVTEYGTRLPREPEDYDESGEQVCITINRSLKKGDSVIMSRVSHGQQFIVLSRYFPVDKAGDDDSGGDDE
jgi:hypothetical protein